jgi:hypothetical protein
MTLPDYIKLAKRTECAYTGVTVTCAALEPYNAARLVHMALGLATEALEFKASLDKNLPRHEQLMEMSDICWFAALAAEELGTAPTEYVPGVYPQMGVQKVLDLCELFASRVKGALYYGNPAKPSDTDPEYWTRIPAEILLRTYAIASAHLSGEDILDLNINKLRARYGEKFSAENAVVRNEVIEAQVVIAGSDLVSRALAARPQKFSMLRANESDTSSPAQA